MAKALFIAEKPSVAQEFAKALGETMRRGDGFVAVSYTHLDVYKRQGKVPCGCTGSTASFSAVRPEWYAHLQACGGMAAFSGTQV